MDPSLSMNTMSGPVDLTELERRAKVHAAQRAAYEAQRRENEADARAELQALQAEVGHTQRAVTQNAAYDSAGAALGNGATVQRGAPGKMFSRVEILAILRAERARYMGGLRIAPVHDCPSEAAVVNAVLNIFENLE